MTRAYALAPTAGYYLPLHSRKCFATVAHAQETPALCRDDQFSLNYTARLSEEKK